MFSKWITTFFKLFLGLPGSMTGLNNSRAGNLFVLGRENKGYTRQIEGIEGQQISRQLDCEKVPLCSGMSWCCHLAVPASFFFLFFLSVCLFVFVFFAKSRLRKINVILWFQIGYILQDKFTEPFSSYPLKLSCYVCTFQCVFRGGRGGGGGKGRAFGRNPVEDRSP